MKADELLLAVGNHLAGLSRHHELAERGARLIGQARTRDTYRLLARGEGPHFNPGLVEVSGGEGVRIAGELYALSAYAIAGLAALVRPPISLGRVRLEDGRVVHGYLCDPAAAETARDISQHSGWRAFLALGQE